MNIMHLCGLLSSAKLPSVEMLVTEQGVRCIAASDAAAAEAAIHGLTQTDLRAHPEVCHACIARGGAMTQINCEASGDASSIGVVAGTVMP